MANVNKVTGVSAGSISKIDGVSKSGISKIDGQTLADPAPFITEWTVGAGVTITLPSYGGTFSYTVDWGDETAIETGVTALNKTHEYTDAGTYTVTITGTFPSLRMSSGTADNALCLRKLVQWGTDCTWRTLCQIFKTCTNLVYEATDAPNLTGLSSLGGNRTFTSPFEGCDAIIDLDLSGWSNTDDFTDFFYAFYGLDYVESINLTGWDMSGGRQERMFYFTGQSGSGVDITLTDAILGSGSCYYMFRNVKFSGNPALDVADASNITNVQSLFYMADGNVSIDLSTWDFPDSCTTLASIAYQSEINSFTFSNSADFSEVTTLSSAFNDCPNLTTVTFPSNADFAKVTNMYRVFYYADNLTTVDFGEDQDFSAVTDWEYTWRKNTIGAPHPIVSVNFLTTTDIQSTTALSGLFRDSQLATIDYDRLLQALDNAGNDDGVLVATLSNYTTAGDGGTAHGNLLAVERGWSITDAGGV
tara:strand:+ start:400 stop:1824 length:1425 start_codon:yes stop_codon:yes gene_type:complete